MRTPSNYSSDSPSRAKEAATVQKMPAFAGAEGFGAYAVGGRGGRVVYVTSLEDYDRSLGGRIVPGSLRWAIEENRGPRTILFQTGGTITLKRDLALRGEVGSFVTIAGQSAPGDGIQLAGRGLVIADGAHDIIIRYLRIRPGVTPFDKWKKPAKLGQPPYLEKWDTDALTIYGYRGRLCHDIIVDHCSLEWAIDENANVWDAAEKITFQYCVFAEGSTFGHYGHPESYPYPHSCGFLAGGAVSPSGEYLTLHHNLFMNNLIRNPQITANGCTVDMVNNVLYNCGSYAVSIDRNLGNPVRQEPRVNIIGNRYIYGPNDKPHHRRMVSLAINSKKDSTTTHEGAIYIHDNIDAYRQHASMDDWEVVFDGSHPARTSETGLKQLLNKRALKPWPTPGIAVTTQSAATVVDSVKKTVGASLPHRDPVDSRLISELSSNGGRIGFGTQESYERHPLLDPGSPVLDSDDDGMPDVWEQSKGLNPQDASDGNQCKGTDGYTNLERYLNELADRDGSR